MKPLSKVWEMVRGDYFDIVFRVRTRVWNPALNGGAGGYEAGDYVDLTGYEGNFQVRATPDAAVMAQGVVTILEPQADPDVTGSVLLEIPEAQALLLVPGTQGFDVQLRDSLTRPKTYISGSLIVYADFTRDVP